MPFEIKVEADAMLKQFDELQKHIADLDKTVPQTFLDWQREDMNRRVPRIDEGSGLSVSTLIYPRGTVVARPGKSTRRRMLVAASRPTRSSKPILRPELYDKLHERMINMVKEACTWR